jgi:hypothetical protein
MSNVKQRVLQHHAKLKAAWLHQIGLMERGELGMRKAGADHTMVDCTAETIQYLRDQIEALDEVDELYDE